MKVWVLTGDKVGTAKSIARSCKLIEQGMGEFLIDKDTREGIQRQLQEIEARLSRRDSGGASSRRASLVESRQSLQEPNRQAYLESPRHQEPSRYAMVTGAALSILVQHSELEKKVMSLFVLLTNTVASSSS